jgi:hypothetical protein
MHVANYIIGLSKHIISYRLTNDKLLHCLFFLLGFACAFIAVSINGSRTRCPSMPQLSDFIMNRLYPPTYVINDEQQLVNEIRKLRSENETRDDEYKVPVINDDQRMSWKGIQERIQLIKDST